MENFTKHVSVLHETTVEHAKETIANKQSATYFIGRGTCPYCRKFAGKLFDVVNETKATIYYINSEAVGQEDALKEFRSLYTIPTVPGFVQVTNGEVSVKCDSSMPIEDIKAFAHLA
ncbi:thioredoxin [Carnobacteriaceae bacterium zg-ZUI252]|nr:thioredoxin [Carnobacteriaceae bacterium zg-ZUI252]QTU82576.1 thioredoxin [Carnobacteriaceae bacterium zg-C25]